MISHTIKRFSVIAKKWFLIGLLFFACFAFFYFHLYHYLSLKTVKAYHASAKTWAINHYTCAVSLYMLIYASLIACAIPCATLMTLVGGFLFGSVAVLFAIFATTLGGMILFLAIRTAIGARIAKKSSGWIKVMEHGFQRNAFYYLLMLRLMPVFPCWISNVSAGALNVPLRTFVLATILGILPATCVYVMVGRGLGKILLLQQPTHLNAILSPSLLLPLFGLAFLSLFPVFYYHVKKVRDKNGQ